MSRSTGGVNYAQTSLNTITGHMYKHSVVSANRKKRASRIKMRYQNSRYNTGLYRNVAVVTPTNFSGTLPACFSALNEMTSDDLESLAFLGFPPSGIPAPEGVDKQDCAISLSGIHPVVHNSTTPVHAGEHVGILVDLTEPEIVHSEKKLRTYDQPIGINNTNFEGIFPVVAPMHEVLKRELFKKKEFVDVIIQISNVINGTNNLKMTQAAFDSEVKRLEKSAEYLIGITKLMTIIQRKATNFYVGKAVSTPTDRSPAYSVVI